MCLEDNPRGQGVAEDGTERNLARLHWHGSEHGTTNDVGKGRGGSNDEHQRAGQSRRTRGGTVHGPGEVLLHRDPEVPGGSPKWLCVY